MLAVRTVGFWIFGTAFTYGSGLETNNFCGGPELLSTSVASNSCNEMPFCTVLGCIAARHSDSSTKPNCFSSLPTDIMYLIAQFLAPINRACRDPKTMMTLIIALSTLDRLFDRMHYFGQIDVAEVLKFHTFLAEISFVKAYSTEQLRQMLLNGAFPMGNLALSLLISLDQSTLEAAFHDLSVCLPKVTDRAARLAAVNFCLDRCADGSHFIAVDKYDQIVGHVFEKDIVSKFRQILKPAGFRISLGMMHFIDADNGLELNRRIALDLNTQDFYQMYWDCIRYPTIVRDADLMAAIHDRNRTIISNLPIDPESMTAVDILNRLKFGDASRISAINPVVFNRLLSETAGASLSLWRHVWARDDLFDSAWAHAANHPSNVSLFTKLAFAPEAFIKAEFDFMLLSNPDFAEFLRHFSTHPESRKKSGFRMSFKSKVLEAICPALARGSPSIAGLETLLMYFFSQEDSQTITRLVRYVVDWVITDLSHVALNTIVGIFGNVIQSCSHRIVHVLNDEDPSFLPELIKLLHPASVLTMLDFNAIRPGSMSKFFGMLGFSRDHILAAVCKINDALGSNDDSLSIAFKQCQHKDCAIMRSPSVYSPQAHSLWFFLCKEYPEEFARHLHPNIASFYQDPIPRAMKHSANACCEILGDSAFAHALLVQKNTTPDQYYGTIISKATSGCSGNTMPFMATPLLVMLPVVVCLKLLGKR